jgi:hypothetical protein
MLGIRTTGAIPIALVDMCERPSNPTTDQYQLPTKYI